MRWIAALAICLVWTSARADDDWGVRRDPFDAAVVRRYKAILAKNPYDDGALSRLVAMYRQHRSVAKLESEYRARLATGEDWASLVVLARIPASGDTLVLWKRAVAVKPDDARAWIAIGDAAKTDAATARDAYLRAAKVAAAPQHKRTALSKLVAAARDPATVDAAYAELIALSPRDGKLWLDRGNAQLAAKQAAAANDSFAAAEALLRTDPERRLTAITSQGLALEALGRPDDALARYRRALELVPRGYFLGQEIALRIVDVERKRKRLDAAIAWIEQRWPTRARGYFEWALLGDLHVEMHRDSRAIEAYRRALAKAPTEVATQRKLIALLDKTQLPALALAQHEAAARLAPGDATLQLELAKRYHPTQPAKALATLDALARRLANNVGVRTAIAALYEEWNEPRRAIGEYVAIANLEPRDPEHAIALGEALWRVDERDKARAAWKRLDKIATADALFRHGEVLANHGAWDEAATPYTRAIAIDARNVDALYGRARAYESLRKFADAIEDARRAVALTGNATFVDGWRTRNLLVRVLAKSYDAGDREALATALARWRFAFDRGDVGAGYLLAAHHDRLRSDEHHDVLVALYRRAPADDALGFAVARSYAQRRQLARAREELDRILRRSPARAKDIAEMHVQLEEEAERIERDLRWEEEGRSHARRSNTEPPDIVGREHRTGVRFEIGTDVREASGALFGIGFYRTNRIARGTTWAWRIDWTQRDDDMLEHEVFAVGGSVATRLYDARRFELSAGAGARLELRYGAGIPTDRFGRGAIGGDVMLELHPRAVPATLGLRFHQSLTDAARSSALLVELGFEVR